MAEVDQAQLESKEHAHGRRVPVIIDNRTVEVQAREWAVSQLKTALGVDASRELEQVVDGKLVPLDDNSTSAVMKSLSATSAAVARPMATETELRELDQLCGGAKEYSEFGLNYILLPQLRLPSGCTPAVLDALLCLSPRDGYPTRLYFAQQVAGKSGLNWNAQNVPILQRSWFAYSWNYVASGRPIEVLAQHLKALP